MKNTPLQKLIDEAENTLYGSQLRWLRAKATELLEEEKQMVVDAYTDGIDFRNEIETESFAGRETEGEQYYNEKFNQA